MLGGICLFYFYTPVECHLASTHLSKILFIYQTNHRYNIVSLGQDVIGGLFYRKKNKSFSTRYDAAKI